MKKVLLFIAILFFFDRFGQAQSLTIEYISVTVRIRCPI